MWAGETSDMTSPYREAKSDLKPRLEAASKPLSVTLDLHQ
jgi:hypothetical protein